MGEKLAEWFEENPNEASRSSARSSRRLWQEAARKARELTRRKTAMDVNFLAGKLKDCLRRTPRRPNSSSWRVTVQVAPPRRAGTV